MLHSLKKTFSANIYLVLLYRIFVVYLMFTLSRMAFFIYNADHFSVSTSHLISLFGAGLIFDTSAIMYVNVLFILGSIIPLKLRYNITYQKVLFYIFVITNAIALMANFMDIPYFDFVLERTTIGVFDQFKNENNMVGLFMKFFIDFWYLVVLYFINIAVLIYLYKRARIAPAPIQKPLVYYPVGLALMAGIVTLSIGGMRGGFAHSTRPITLSNAGQYVKAPIEMGIVLNTPFCLMRSTESKSFKRVEFFKDKAELEKWYNPVHQPDTTRKGEKVNVVIFILESFNKEFIGSFYPELDGGKYKGYAPFLDSIVSVSKTYKYSFANGRKSIEAMPSVLASIPSIETPFVLSPYYSKRLNTLPGLLKEMGYKSAFFHGAPNGSMGFQAFAQLAGVDEYYGKTEYNNDADFDGMWGIWDEEFFQYYAHTLDTFSKPFVASLFSVTSHHPFVLPKKYDERFKSVDFPLQRCVEYTDYSLKRFFETASKMKWFKNTLFIFTADHVSLNQRPEFQNELGYFSVPVIFYRPGQGLQNIDTMTIAQQIDIMPTVLNYIGYNKPYVAFGNDIFSNTQGKFAVNYLNGTYRIYQGDYMLQFDGIKSVHLYNMRQDPLLLNDILGKEPDVQGKLENQVKAFIQQYKNRMIDNEISIK